MSHSLSPMRAPCTTPNSSAAAGLRYYDEQNKLIGIIEVMVDTSVKKAEMAALTEFGKGNFDFEPEMADGKKAVIDPSIERLRTNVKAFIEEMKNMAEAHNAGDIDAVIPEEQFEGSYRAMAKGVDDMVMGHISVKKKAMACIAQFGKGNFEAELEKFPGKKHSSTRTLKVCAATARPLSRT
jgi:methyl-accepting chemotaxis protein